MSHDTERPGTPGSGDQPSYDGGAEPDHPQAAVPGTAPGEAKQGGVVANRYGEFSPARTDESVPNPGLPAHQWRPTDVDPRLEKRAERQVALFFVAAQVFVVLFVVAYFVFDISNGTDTLAFGLGASTVTLGSTLGLALLCIGVGIIQWARKLMGDHEIVEMRHPARSSDDDRAETLEALRLGTEESGIGRRPLEIGRAHV